MKKKAFTLIELLAVIVILVIIALITIPLILNIINNSKEKARLRSIANIEDQAFFYYTKHALVSNKANGNIYNEVMETIKGEKPDKGEIKIKDGKKMAYALKYGTSCYKKGYDDSGVKKIENAEECTTSDYLKSESNFCFTSYPFLDGPAREEIETVTFLDHQEMGSNVLGTWRATEQDNDTIMGWYKDEDSNGLYEVYIGAEGGVVANPNSSFLFAYCTNLKEIDFSNFDTTNATNMSWMFYGCGLTSLDLASFDTTNVTDMSFMFSGCSSLTSLDLTSFDSSNVATMGAMFYGCSSLASLNLTSFVTSNVTDMGGMFEGCSSLTSLNLAGFDTSSVTDMSRMFTSCSSLTSLDLASFDTTNVTDMSQMFLSCDGLTSLNVTSFDISKGTYMMSMFEGCSSLTSLDLTSFDISNGSGNWIFFKCSKLETVYVNETSKDAIKAIVGKKVEVIVL